MIVTSVITLIADEVAPDLTTLLLVNAVAGLLLPLLVQLVIKAHTTERVKVLVNLVLTAITATLAPLAVGDGHLDWKAIALSFAQIFGTTIIAHYGLLKPLGVTGSDGLIATAVPGGVGAGLGDPPTPP